jgi:hypothetical protein
MKTMGIVGSVVLLVALAVAFMKQALALIGLLLWAVKAIIVLAFIGVMIVLGYMAYKHFSKEKAPLNCSLLEAAHLFEMSFLCDSTIIF